MKRKPHVTFATNPSDLTPTQALELLHEFHEGEGHRVVVPETGEVLHVDELQPVHEAREVLFAAYPQFVHRDARGRRVDVDWFRLLDAVLVEFVPAFQAAGRPGRKRGALGSKTKRQTAIAVIDEAKTRTYIKSVRQAAKTDRARIVYGNVKPRSIERAYQRGKKATGN